jgi:hypothetical protein
MKCLNCGQESSAVFGCGNCGDVRCLKCHGKTGPKSSSSSATAGNYNQLACLVCRKHEVKRIS